MDRGAGGAVAVVGCLLVASIAVGGAVGTGAAAGTSAVPQTDGVDPDSVVLRADVAANGSATWTIEYRVRLDDGNATDAFDGLQADVRANRSAYADRFATRMGRTVAAAENATGREMRLANVTVTAERRQLPQSYGVVSYRFEWTGFARTDGDRLIVGDALAGLFLDAESRLILSWPAGYEPTSVSPQGYEEREEAVVWSGPVDFGPEEPRIVLSPAGGFPTEVVAALLVLLGAGVAIWRYRRRGGSTADSPDDGDGTDAGAAVEPDEEGTVGTPPEELLSPEERVLRLVRERGGRVKQQEIVQQFDWTAARTSQVVGNLREDGQLETFRLGRENVLTLPDADVTGGDADDPDDPDDPDEAEADGGTGVSWRLNR